MKFALNSADPLVALMFATAGILSCSVADMSN